MPRLAEANLAAKSSCRNCWASLREVNPTSVPSGLRLYRARCRCTESRELPVPTLTCERAVITVPSSPMTAAGSLSVAVVSASGDKSAISWARRRLTTTSRSRAADLSGLNPNRVAKPGSARCTTPAVRPWDMATSSGRVESAICAATFAVTSSRFSGLCVAARSFAASLSRRE